MAQQRSSRSLMTEGSAPTDDNGGTCGLASRSQGDREDDRARRDHTTSLAFDASGGRYAGARKRLIKQLFGLSSTRCYQSAPTCACGGPAGRALAPPTDAQSSGCGGCARPVRRVRHAGSASRSPDIRLHEQSVAPIPRSAVVKVAEMKADREQNRASPSVRERCCCCRWQSCSSGLPGIRRPRVA